MCSECVICASANQLPGEKDLRPDRIATPPPLIAVILLSVALLVGRQAMAADYSLTGFGTIGYAVSDLKAPYLRYIDKSGTLRADSLIGLQGEAQFDPQWGATVQVVASAPRYKDNGVAAQVRWAFASYRPNNEWLIRAGRLRPPVLINTQNAEVGVTYEQARLPQEIYSLSPAYDVDGIAVTKTIPTNDSEIVLDGYIGRSKTSYRAPFQRDSAQTIFPDKYFPEEIGSYGIAASKTSGPLSFHMGIHKVELRPDKGRQFVDSFNPVSLPAPSPFGGTIYLPGVVIDKIDVHAIAIGVEYQSKNWRLVGEYGQRIIKDTKMAVGSKAASFMISRQVDEWTPYVAYAKLLSPSETRDFYKALNGTPVPLLASFPPFSQSATYHQVLADGVSVLDQHSIMFGSSYRINLTSRIKFEWMRTKVGLASALIDGDVHHKSFNVFSLSYNFSF